MGRVWRWLTPGVLLTVALSAFGQGNNQADSSKVSEHPSVSRAQGAVASPLGPDAPKPTGWLEPGTDPENRLGTPFLKHIVGDQKQFWTEPTHFKVQDLKWIVPFTGVTAAFIASDSWWSRQVNPAHQQTSLHISDYGAYSLIGLGGASFLLGHVKHDDHLAETGLLAGEAAINATGVAYLFKEVTQRQRPLQGEGNGNFFTGGASFPSEHSAIAWSIASVWAHEYPGWLSQAAAYGLATTISATRVTAKQHFPSDAIVGSALGWYFGRQVYRAHHDPEVGGSGWGNLLEDNTAEKTRNPDHMASPYVPLDSWIYPALERLAALGYIHSHYLGIRPWSRMACAEMIEEAGAKLGEEAVEYGEAGKIYSSLVDEFSVESGRLNGEANVGMRVDSVYTRATGISGTPVRDGYHFGQTIIDDYGRPYWSGFNDVTGVSADAEVGYIAFSFQGEYQHAPARPSESPAVLAATAAADGTPSSPNGSLQINQFQLLNSMALVKLGNIQLSFGEQSQWMGPGESGALLMSNNAAPFPAVKVDEVSPHHIPGFSKILGPVRSEIFLGQLSGQQWELCTVPSCKSFPGFPGVVGPNIVRQPFMQGAKISFKPHPDLEIGMGVTTMFGGPGLPVTFGNYFNTYYVHTPNLAKNPGKRVTSADITFRVPHIKDWLTLYFDSMAWDEISPIGSQRANINPGIYLPKIPKINKLDLRAEGFNISRTKEFVPGWVYYNGDRYRSGYTNDGTLIGSWIGRAGRGGQGWLTYWLSSRNKIQAGYRLQTVSPNFIEGGRLVDYSANTEFMVGHNMSVSGLMQYEQWRFPVITTTRQSDVAVSVQMTFYPHWKSHN